MRIQKAAVLLLELMVPAAGCSAETQNIADPGTRTDGVYEQAAEGKNSSFNGQVTIEDGYMTDIVVGSNRETPERGGAVIAALPGAMLEAQSFDAELRCGRCSGRNCYVECTAGRSSKGAGRKQRLTGTVRAHGQNMVMQPDQGPAEIWVIRNSA